MVTENIQTKKNEINLLPVVNTIAYHTNKQGVTKTVKDSIIAIDSVELKYIPLSDLLVDIDTIATANTITTKKKISVVHINELEEEDRIAEQNINIAKSFKKNRTKIADKSEYAGTIKFRIHFKN
jgi:hypothetical protein